MTTKLSLANLETVSKTAGVPAYARSALKAGIVHFVEGSFGDIETPPWRKMQVHDEKTAGSSR